MDNDYIAKTNVPRGPQRQCQWRWDTVLGKMGLCLRVEIGNGYISYRFRLKKKSQIRLFIKRIVI